MPSTPSCIISSKKARTLLASAPSNSVVLVVTRKPRLTASRIASGGDVIAAFPANGEIVMFFLAIDVHAEKLRYLLGLKRSSFSLSSRALVQR